MRLITNKWSASFFKRDEMKIFSCLILLVACAGKADTTDLTPFIPQGPIDSAWTFETTPVWADEFDYTGLPDKTKWGYDIGGSGWGNNELEYYTDSISNAEVASGVLTITAKKEAKGGRNYTSARLVTKGKGDFLYGRIEVKAKLPAGKGTWPAIWMLPTDWAYGGWPKSGEIDIMEHVGYDPNVVHITAHTEAYYFKINTQKTSTKKTDNATTAFHVYRMDWTPYALRGYIDDQLIFQFANEGKGYTVWPFDKKFHLLLNVAVGGDWGGAQGVDETIFPAAMQVDYVRVYKMINK
jgi:beta-glucanase (GH16 family)